jgi:hypothetical protein
MAIWKRQKFRHRRPTATTTTLRVANMWHRYRVAADARVLPTGKGEAALRPRHLSRTFLLFSVLVVFIVCAGVLTVLLRSPTYTPTPSLHARTSDQTNTNVDAHMRALCSARVDHDFFEHLQQQVYSSFFAGVEEGVGGTARLAGDDEGVGGTARLASDEESVGGAARLTGDARLRSLQSAVRCYRFSPEQSAAGQPTRSTVVDRATAANTDSATASAGLGGLWRALSPWFARWFDGHQTTTGFCALRRVLFLPRLWADPRTRADALVVYSATHTGSAAHLRLEEVGVDLSVHALQGQERLFSEVPALDRVRTPTVLLRRSGMWCSFDRGVTSRLQVVTALVSRSLPPTHTLSVGVNANVSNPFHLMASLLSFSLLRVVRPSVST